MKKYIFILFFSIFVANIAFSQQKKPLDFSVYDGWNTIEGYSVSDDGKWVAYEVSPYKGDGKLVIMNPDRLIEKVFRRGTKAVFSPSSKYVAFKVVPQDDSIRQLKLKKVKKDKMPKDSLKLWVFKPNKLIEVSELNSFEIPEENSEWLAYTYTVKEKEEGKEKKNGKKVKDAPTVYDLVITNPIKDLEYRFKNVSEFTTSRNGKLIGFIQIDADSILRSKVSVFDTEKEDIQKIFENEGLAKKVCVDNSGKQSSFIFSADSTKTKVYSLYYWASDKLISSEVVIDTNSLKMPKDWVVSENGSIWFSRDDSKMYFGTALRPEPEEKDTLLDEEKVKVDVWSWTDPLLQTQQLVELKKELKRTYLTVYHPGNKKVALLASEQIPDINTIQHGNANIAFGIADKDFQAEKSWQFPSRKDYYIVDVNTGDKEIVLEKTTAETDISPFGNYVFWFDKEKRAWFAKNTKNFKVVDLTSSIKVNFFDEEYDQPTEVPSYGYAGWTKDDKYFLVYDRFDIWKIDPLGNEPPTTITNESGRKSKNQFRYQKLDKDLEYIDISKPIMLSAFNLETKKSGYYSVSFGKSFDLKQLIFDSFNFFSLIKAKQSNHFIWRKMSVKEYPDLWYSDDSFKEPLKISYVNPQQEKYNWATAELVKWKTFDNKTEEGLLYKPENFDPNKKYPMIVYFYDLKSDGLFYHYSPKPSRSTISPIYYASNGYLVFMPNIRYEIGYPGKSAYNYIVSGTKAMIAQGFVDEKNIGIQGQSWGGYEAAYLVTQTNMYKAASAGAAVTNMTSAYGGIRWQSGISRMYQYEDTQSRIGATLWEKPELYFKNSPIFYADKIETPLLLRHNDADGAVPWYQSIELFVALRRLNKPVWLLNYNDEPHNLKDKSPGCKDLSIRMFQFFEHYLKGKPAPVWLVKGIPAIKKGKELGYDLIKENM